MRDLFNEQYKMVSDGNKEDFNIKATIKNGITTHEIDTNEGMIIQPVVTDGKEGIQVISGCTVLTMERVIKTLIDAYVETTREQVQPPISEMYIKHFIEDIINSIYDMEE